MYRKYVKRILDLIISIIVFPFWLIILLFIGPVIYLEDKGSIFYNAERLGKNGTKFKMYKFRSMKMQSADLRNEDGSTFNSKNDPRLTKIGGFIRKTSIDETPQLLNVIKGDMSIIGPRPTISTKPFKDIKGIRLKRYEVKPGITGYTQAYFRNSISQSKKFDYDVEYVENVSFKFDLKIFMQTIKTVFSRKNIYVDTELEKKNEKVKKV